MSSVSCSSQCYRIKDTSELQSIRSGVWSPVYITIPRGSHSKPPFDSGLEAANWISFRAEMAVIHFTSFCAEAVQKISMHSNCEFNPAITSTVLFLALHGPLPITKNGIIPTLVKLLQQGIYPAEQQKAKIRLHLATFLFWIFYLNFGTVAEVSASWKVQNVHFNQGLLLLTSKRKLRHTNSEMKTDQHSADTFFT